MDAQTNPRPAAEQLAWVARQLWAGRLAGVLSTHSLDLPGYPFGSLVPYCLDADGMPLVLLSHLAQHTKNLEADGHCSLTVTASGDGDVQRLARLVAVGDMEPIPADQGGRFLRYFPHTEVYLRELNFRFHRLRPRRFHFNNGFTSARWFDPERILHPNPLAPGEELAILAHMNRDHPVALSSYLRRTGVSLTKEDSTVRMVGMDGEGIDLARNLGDEEQLHRLALPRPIADRHEARQVLIEMAHGDD